MDSDRGDVDERDIETEVSEYVARPHSTYTPLANVPRRLSEDAIPKPWWDTPDSAGGMHIIYLFYNLRAIFILISTSVPFYFMAEDIARYTLDTSAALLALVTLSLIYFLFDTHDAPPILALPAVLVLVGATVCALCKATEWIAHHTPRQFVLGAVLGCFTDLPPPLRAEIAKLLIHVMSLYGLYVFFTRYTVSVAWVMCGSVVVHMFPWKVVFLTAVEYLARPIIVL